jgi:hypothetical protein
MACAMGVSTGPVATALTRMPWRARSLASTCVSTFTAPFTIGAAPLAAAQPRHRADVDDRPPARVAHDARGGAGDQERADDVDLERLAKELERRFEGGNVGGDAGRIDHAVDAAERLARHGDRLFRAGLVGDVERWGEQALWLGNARCKACQRGPIAIDGRHLRPARSSRATVARPMPDPAPVTSATLSPPSLALAMRLTCLSSPFCAPSSAAGRRRGKDQGKPRDGHDPSPLPVRSGAAGREAASLLSSAWIFQFCGGGAGGFVLNAGAR